MSGNLDQNDLAQGVERLDAQRSAAGGATYVASEGAASVQIDNADLMFNGTYTRSGPDLVIMGADGQQVVVLGYFSSAAPATLVSPDGALLSGDLVSKLAGPRFPGSFAQATPGAAGPAIGQVETINGQATARRADGTSVALQPGTAVYQGDVIETGIGGALNITFVDRTILTLSESARMVLDQYVYNPGGAGNSSLLNLVQGTFVFVAGQIAPTGSMRIETPVATLGIRGTTGVVEVGSSNGITNYTLVPDPDGRVGQFDVFNKINGQLLFSATQANDSLVVRSASGDFERVVRLPDQIATQQQVVGLAFSTYNAVQTRVQSGQPAVAPTNTGTPVAPGTAPGQTPGTAPGGTTPGPAPQQGAPQQGAPQGTTPDPAPGQPAAPTEQRGGEAPAPTDQPQLAAQQPALPDLATGTSETDLLGNISSSSTGSAATGDAPSGQLVSLLTDTSQNEVTTAAPAPPPPAPTVTPVSTPPSISIPSIIPTVNEDGAITLTGFSISAPSAPTVTTSINAQSTVTLASTAGLTFTVGDGVDDEIMVFTGSPEAVQAALNGLTYTASPNNDVAGGITISVNDGSNLVTATITVPIAPAPDAPTAVADLITVSEDGIGTGSVLTNDRDIDTGETALLVVSAVDGSPANVGVPVSLASGATVTLQANGTFAFDAADQLKAGQTGSDSFSYTIVDPTGRTSTATVSVTITGANDAPVAVAGTASTAEDVAIGIDVAGLISDVDTGTAFTIQAAVPPSEGTVSVSGTVITFTPALNFNGTATVTYTVLDDGAPALTGTSTLSVAVSGANDPPVASDDAVSVTEGMAGTGNVLGNDTDPDAGDTSALVVDAVNGSPANVGTPVTLTSGATLTLQANGSFTIDAPESLRAGEMVTDTFTYTARDPSGASDNGTVTVTSTGTNDAPTAAPGSATTPEDTAVAIDVAGLIGDIDDGTVFTVQASVPPTEGSVAVSGTVITFTPAANFTGTANIAYTVLDDGTPQLSASSTVAVTVNPANDAPTGDPITLTVGEDGPVSADLVTDANGADIDGPTAPPVATGTPGSITTTQGRVLTAGTHYTLSGASFVLTVAGLAIFDTLAASTNDSFTLNYTLSDGVTTTPNTLTVTVNGTNDAPTVDNPVADTSVAVGGALNYTIPANAFGDIDAGTALTYAAQLTGGGALPAWLSFNAATRTFSGTPAIGDRGTLSIDVIASDGTASVVDTLLITVGPNIVGDANANTLTGTAGDDFITALAGNDTIAPGAGNDVVDGGADIDTVDYSSTTAGVTVNLLTGVATGSEIGSDTLVGIENVIGGAGDDVLTGDSADNRLEGGVGNNRYVGGGGDDTFVGGARGHLVLDFDTVDYRGETGPLTINISGGLNSTSSTVTGAGVGTDILVNIDRVLGSDGGDTYTADSTVVSKFDGSRFSEFEGGLGDDTVTGNGSTRVGYGFADGAVSVNLATGTASGYDPDGAGPLTAATNVGTDTFVLGNLAGGANGVTQVRGSAFNDQLTGSNGTWFESFRGQGGDDTIDGGGGSNDQADYLNAPGAIVATLGTSGVGTGTVQDGYGTTDTLLNIEQIRGSRFDDTITGDSGNNRLRGDAGNDTISGGAGNDQIEGGDGNDILESGNGPGNDTLVGGAGNDTLRGPTTVSSINDGADADYRTATGAINVLLGTTTGTVIGDASVGTDTLERIDRVLGSAQDDTFEAQAGYVGSDGTNFNEFRGGAGNDTITGNGNTRVDYADATAGVTVNLATGTATGAGVGTDTFTLGNLAGGANGVTQVRGSNHGDTIVGSNGAWFESFRGQAGNDSIDGGGGSNDRADYRNAPSGIVAVMGGSGIGTGTVQDGHGTTDTLTNIERIRGSEFVDSITGDAGANILEGRSGDDTIDGAGGNDTLIGDDGADNLSGGTGRNTYIGGAGNDTLTGITTPLAGTANVLDRNIADYSGASGPITVNLGTTTTVTGNATVGTDTLTGVETIRGTAFADTFIAGTGFTGIFEESHEFIGGGSDDTITGNGATIVSYSDSTAGVTASLQFSSGGSVAGGVGTDIYIGGIGGLRGSALNDTLEGSDSVTRDETFIGGAGSDTIDGRGGFDRLEYVESPGAVTVSFATGQANDGFGGVDTFINIEEVSGSNFNDTLTGNSQANVFEGNLGDDTIDGQGGRDTALYLNASQAVTVNLATGSASGADIGTDTLISIEDVDAGEGDDTITGNAADNRLEGNDGADTIDGGAGSNTLIGDAGNDTLIGGIGSDVRTEGDVADYRDGAEAITAVLTGAFGTSSSTVVGGASVGSDTLRHVERVVGTDFNDTFTADVSFESKFFENNGTLDRNGFNLFEGGDGNDTITGNGDTRVSYAGADGAVTVDLALGTGAGSSGGATNVGSDTFTLANLSGGANGVTQINGSSHGDTLRGSNGAWFERFQGNAGDDTIDGRGGIEDEVDYRNSPGAVTVNLTTGTASDGWGGTDTLSNIERARGSEFADTLTGSSVDNNLTGRDGDDTLIGVAGGFDIYVGGRGNDTITGTSTLLNPVTDGDRATYSESDVTGGIVVTLGTSSGGPTAGGLVVGDASVGTDTLTAIEQITGTRFVDTYTAFANFSDGTFGAFNAFEGGDGNDVITGNNNTRVRYVGALAGVTVDLDPNGDSNTNDGFAQSTAGGNAAGIGVDDFGSGINSAEGSEFDDIIFGSNSTTVTEFFRARGGNDTIDGRGGQDEADYRNAPGPTGITVVMTTSGADVTNDGTGGQDTLINVERIRGTQFADSITMDNANNTVRGEGGNDTIFGLGGNDTLEGGDGDDTLDGGSGQNTYRGGAGADTFIGGTGTSNTADFDTADYATHTGPIIVTLTGAFASGNPGSQVVDDGLVTDTLTRIDRVIGTAFDDEFNADTTYTNRFHTVGSPDSTHQFEGGDGNDTINGNGQTRVRYVGANGAVEVDIANGTSQGWSGGTDAAATNVGVDTFTDISGGISGVHGAIGSNFADRLIGSNDSVFETFSGLAGNDIIDGGGGTNDRIDHLGAPAGIVANLTTGVVQDGHGTTDTVSNIERVRGSEFADDITGNALANRLEGQGGADIIRGLGGADDLRGGGGDDTMIDQDALFTRIDGGTGQDLLQLVTDGGVFSYDLTLISNTVIQGTERLFINGGGSTNLITLRLNADDVINMSTEVNTDFLANIGALQHNATDNISVGGNVDDVLELVDQDGAGAGTWSTPGNITFGATTYEVWNYVSGASVLASIAVEDDVTVSPNV